MVNGAEDTVRKQLRAYINVASARISNENNVQTVHFEVKNFGQTPASKIVIWFDAAVGDLEWQSAMILQQTTNVQKFEGGVMGPTSAFTMQLRIQLLADAGSKMEEAKKAFYFGERSPTTTYSISLILLSSGLW